MWAFIVAWGDFIIGGVAFVAGVYVEQKFGVYPKIKAAYDWIKAKF